MSVTQVCLQGVNGPVRYKRYKFRNRTEAKHFLSKLNLAGCDVQTVRFPRRFNVIVKLA